MGRARELPQTCCRGMRVPSWGDYLEEECTRVGSADYDNVNIVWESTCIEVHTIIDELVNKDKISADRVVVGGFSMGATAAAEIALRFRDRLAGLIVLNGWLSHYARGGLRTYPLKGFPVLISHGSADEMVGFDCAEEAVKLLQAAEAAVQFEVQEKQTHVTSGF